LKDFQQIFWKDYKRTWNGHLVTNWTALFGGLFWGTRADILNGEVTAAEGWNDIAVQAQDVLDNTFNQ